MHPALVAMGGRRSDLRGTANHAPESVAKLAHQFDPGLGPNPEPFQDGSQVRGDRAPLIRSHLPARSVQERQVVVQVEIKQALVRRTPAPGRSRIPVP